MSALSDLLRQLQPTRYKGLEGLVAVVLADALGLEWRIEASGSQHGRDVALFDRTTGLSRLIDIEVKRYKEDRPPTKRELYGEIGETWLARPDTELWVVVSTAMIPAAVVDGLNKLASQHGIQILVVDCAPDGCSLLEVMIARRAEITLDWVTRTQPDDLDRWRAAIEEVKGSPAFEVRSKEVGDRIINRYSAAATLKCPSVGYGERVLGRRERFRENSRPLSKARHAIELPPAFAGHRNAGQIARGRWSLDLWTPGQSADAIMHHLGTSLGPEEAKLLQSLSNDAVSAIGESDFTRQLEVAEATMAIGASAPETPLLGEGLYLKAEALRLLADFEPDLDRQLELRAEAVECYGMAEEQLRGDPRAIRGHARTLESMGDLNGGLRGLRRAQAVLHPLKGDRHPAVAHSLAHEEIRTLRHEIMCLASIHVQSPSSTLQGVQREGEIRRLIPESELKHTKLLNSFKGKADRWLQIEWFTSLVLHAKAWAAIGEPALATTRLMWSLEARLKLMPKKGTLTLVELGNLHWWAMTAGAILSDFADMQKRPLATLLDLIRDGADRATIHGAGRSFLRADSPPWI